MNDISYCKKPADHHANAAIEEAEWKPRILGRGHPKGRLSFTLCPKGQRMNKRIKVTEPNVSVPGHGQGWS